MLISAAPGNVYNPDKPDFGIYYDVPATTYHNSAGISKSQLDLIAQSPAHFLRKRQWRETSSTRLGSALHKFLLEYKDFYNCYMLAPRSVNRKSTSYGKQLDRRGTKEWNDLERKHKKIILKQDEWQTIHDEAEAVSDYLGARYFLDQKNTRCEISIYWKDIESGILCRGRPDGHNKQLNVLIDVKRLADISDAGFGRIGARFGYPTQAAYYMDGWEALDFRPDAFVFILVESETGFVRTIELPDHAIKKGEEYYRKYLDTYKACMTGGEFYGYCKGQGLEKLDVNESYYYD